MTAKEWFERAVIFAAATQIRKVEFDYVNKDADSTVS